MRKLEDITKEMCDKLPVFLGSLEEFNGTQKQLGTGKVYEYMQTEPIIGHITYDQEVVLDEFDSGAVTEKEREDSIKRDIRAMALLMGADGLVHFRQYGLVNRDMEYPAQHYFMATPVRKKWIKRSPCRRILGNL